MQDEALPNPALPTYAQNARPVGFPVSYVLDGTKLVVDSTRKVETVDLASVREVRLTFEPKSFATKVFRTRLTLEGGRDVSYTSISWAGMVQARRQDAAYAAFTRALLLAVGQASPQARFIAGRGPVAWATLAVLTFATLVGVSLFAVQALRSEATGAALMGIALGVFGLWQMEPMVRLNRPRPFTPDAPPPALLG